MSALRVWKGQECRALLSFVDEAGAPIAATGVTITARSPVSNVLLPLVPVQLPGVGKFAADFIGAEVGVWWVRGQCTGPAIAVDEASVTVFASQVMA
ncbi:hypothetical protein [Muricoccus vinaceus]|uniref:Uncharacterized protein n=1 Tax=Muricoccus vinaceus TaxID=424704 RepID=A0ABV6IL25_9PROT